MVGEISLSGSPPPSLRDVCRVGVSESMVNLVLLGFEPSPAVTAASVCRGVAAGRGACGGGLVTRRAGSARARSFTRIAGSPRAVVAGIVTLRADTHSYPDRDFGKDA